jgi:hypothetical protein
MGLEVDDDWQMMTQLIPKVPCLKSPFLLAHTCGCVFLRRYYSIAIKEVPMVGGYHGTRVPW